MTDFDFLMTDFDFFLKLTATLQLADFHVASYNLISRPDCYPSTCWQTLALLSWRLRELKLHATPQLGNRLWTLRFNLPANFVLWPCLIYFCRLDLRVFMGFLSCCTSSQHGVVFLVVVFMLKAGFKHLNSLSFFHAWHFHPWGEVPQISLFFGQPRQNAVCEGSSIKKALDRSAEIGWLLGSYWTKLRPAICVRVI